MPAAEVFHVQITASGASQVRREAAESNAALGGIGKNAGAVASRIGVIGKAAAAIGIAVGVVAVKAAVDFNQQMTLVQTQAGASAQEVARLRGEVLQLATHSEFGPTQLAQGLFRVESAGFRGAKAMQVLHAAQNLAAVGQSDLEATTYAVTAAMNSQIKGTETAAKTVSVLNAAVGLGNMRMEDLTGALSTGILPSAKAFGLTLTDVTSALDLFTRSGTPAQAAATRLRMSFALMAGSASGPRADALAQIGLTTTKLAQDMRKPQGLLRAVEDLRHGLESLPGGPTGVQATTLLTQAFGGGRTSGGIITMVQQVDQLRQIYGDAGAAAAKFGQDVQAQAETPAAKFKTAWAAIQVDLVDLGSKIMPMVAGEATKLANIISSPNMSPSAKVGAIATELGHVFAQLAPAVAKAGVQLGGGLAQGIVTGMLHNNLLTDLFTAGLLIRVFGGPGALTAVGRKIGEYIGIGVAEGETAATAGGSALTGAAAAGAGAGGAVESAAVGAGAARVSASQAGRQAAADMVPGIEGGLIGGLRRVNWKRIGNIGGFIALGTAGAAAFQTGWDANLGNRVVGGGHATLLADITSPQGIAAAKDTFVNMGHTIGLNFGHTAGEDFNKEFQRELQQASANVGHTQIMRNMSGAITSGAVSGGQSLQQIFGKTWSNLTPDERDLARTVNTAAHTYVGLMHNALNHNITRRQQVDMSAFIRKDPATANQLVGNIRGDVTGLHSGAITNLGDINKVAGQATRNLQAAVQRGLGPDAARALQITITRETAGAIANGIQHGAIPATKRNLATVRNLFKTSLLLRGSDPLGLAKGFSNSWKRAHTINDQSIRSAVNQLKLMPPQARTQAAQAMLGFAAELQAKGRIPLSALQDLRSKFGAQLKIFPQQAKGVGPLIVSAFAPMVPGIAGILSNVKDNVNNALKGMGSHNTVAFNPLLSLAHTLGFNTSGLGQRRGGALVNGQPVNSRDGFIGTVPGSGTGDKVPYSVITEPGEGLFVMNRNAMGALQAHNDAHPRDQLRSGGAARGRSAPTLRVQVKGPQGGMLYDLQGGTDKVVAAANHKLAQVFAANVQPGGPAGGGVAFGPRGVGSYRGVSMANWVIQALQYAAQHGSGDPQPTSGYRPGFDSHTQTGTSEHQGTQYPHGAVDFGGMVDPPAYPKKMAVVNGDRSFRMPLIAPIGFHDDGHASGTGHRRGGMVQRLRGGGSAKNQPSPWVTVGATYEGLDGHQGAGGRVGGVAFAELLVAGDNRGMWQQDLASVLHLPNHRGTGMPMHTRLHFKVPGSAKEAVAIKNDIGSGQGGNPYYKVDVQTGLMHAIGWNTGKPIMVSKTGGAVQGSAATPSSTSTDSLAVLPAKLRAEITKLQDRADTTGQWADMADQLGAPVHGKGMIDWLLEELTALFQLRNAIVAALDWILAQTKAANDGTADPKGKKKKKQQKKKGGGKSSKQPGQAAPDYSSAQSDLTSTLEEVQGKGGDSHALLPQQPIGVFGGKIFDVQKSLKDAGAPDTTGESATSSALADALQQQLDDANKRAYVLAQQYPVLSRIPQIIGAYAAGRDLGPGGWALVGERGPELAQLQNGGGVVNADNTRAFARYISETGGTGAGGQGVEILEPHLHVHGPLTENSNLDDQIELVFERKTRAAASKRRRRTRV